MLQGQFVDEGWLFTSLWGKKVKNGGAAPKQRRLLDSFVDSQNPGKQKQLPKPLGSKLKLQQDRRVVLTPSQQTIHQTLNEPKKGQ